MKDFKSYQKNNANQGKNEPSKATVNENSEMPTESQAEELARKALAAYNGKSEGTVLLEILRQAEAGKRAGTLTNADIDAFYAQFAPMLEEGPRKKLQAVLERLKKI